MENLQISDRQNLSYCHFIALVRNMKDPDFPETAPLYRFLFGPNSVKEIFFHLINWMPYSKRKDGAVYKSAAELAYRTGYSSRTVERAQSALAKMGFETFVKKANGTPTNHYRFDLEKFLQYIAAKLKTTADQIRIWMGNPVMVSTCEKVSESVQNGGVNSAVVSESTPNMSRSSLGTSVGVESDKTMASLTTNEITEKTDNIQNNIKTTTTEDADYREEVVVDSSSLKMEVYSFAATLKIPYTLTERLIGQYGLERVKQVTKRAVEDPKVRNPGGWAKLALENNYQWAEKVPFTPDPKPYTGGLYTAFIRS